MEEAELIKKVLSMDKRQRFLYSLMYYDGKSPFFITDLERYFGCKNPQQDIREVIKALIKISVIIETEKRNGDFMLKLNKKLLEKLIRQSDVFLTNGKFIEETRSVYSY